MLRHSPPRTRSNTQNTGLETQPHIENPPSNLNTHALDQSGHPINGLLNTPQDPPVVRSEAQIAALTVKLPQFWTNCPEAWFLHAEMQFGTRGIVSDTTKFEYVVTALPQEIIMSVLDVVQNPPLEERYIKLKKTLIERHTISESRRLDKILSDTEIGDRKPSEFYRSLVLLAGTNFSADVLKKLWLRKLPKSLNVALTGSNLSDVEQLTRLADNLWDVLQGDDLCSIKLSNINATQSSSNFSDLRTVVENLVRATTDICESVRNLSLEVSSMRKQFDQYPRRSRSVSRNRAMSRNASQNRGWLCKYHYRFGINARKCEQPCSFSETNNQSLN